nr:AAA family ATPase [Streptomyces sp. GC420]
MQSQGAHGTTTAATARVRGALPGVPLPLPVGPAGGLAAQPAGSAPQALPAPCPDRARVRDLRGRVAAGPRALSFATGDLVVVSGLPGSGKSTLIRRTAAAPVADSQDAREHWERRLPAALPYALYRPLVRAAHYRALRRRLREGESVIVHDCGSLVWVRRWLAREARRRGRELHLVLLDVTPETALAGQASRGRGVSWRAFARHRRAVGRLVGDAESGRVPDGCASVHLFDRGSAGTLTTISFTD